MSCASLLSHLGADMATVDPEAARIASFLAQESLCLSCLSTKAEVPRERAEEIVRSIASTLNLSEEAGHCALCVSPQLLYRIQ